MSSQGPQNVSSEKILLENCEIIWGKGDYECDIDGGYDGGFQCYVKNGGMIPLTGTGVCYTPEKAWKELRRMLDTWAKHIKSGQPMTTEQQLDVFGGPDGRNKKALLEFLEYKEKMEHNDRKKRAGKSGETSAMKGECQGS